MANVVKVLNTLGKLVERVVKDTDRGTQASRGVTNAIRPKTGKLYRNGKLVSKNAVTSEPRKAGPVKRVLSADAPNVGGGQKTTTGQRRVKVSDAEATAIAKEAGRRPIAPRGRDIPKPSTKSLTPNEKRYEALGKKAKVTVTKKKPMNAAEIKANKVSERKAKFDKLLDPTTGKVEGPKKNPATFRPQLPKHKVLINIPKVPKNILTLKRKLVGKTVTVGTNKKGEPIKMDAFKYATTRGEMAQANKNPANWDIASNRPKADISKGRGIHGEKVKSVTKTDNPEIRKGEIVEKAQQAKANRGGPKFTKKVEVKSTKGKVIGKQTVSVSKIDSPKNVESNEQIMADRLKQGVKAADAENVRLNKAKEVRIKRNAPKVDKTLADAAKARKEKSLTATFNKPLNKR